MNETARRYLATAAHHDKMARVFRSVKRETDAKAAEEAAKKCRVIAGVFLADEAPKVAA